MTSARECDATQRVISQLPVDHAQGTKNTRSQQSGSDEQKQHPNVC
jgi:hypothetical protein